MEPDLPPILCDYMCRRAFAGRRPVYLHLDRRGRILSGGGYLEDHRLTPLAIGQPVSTIFDFMEGMLPLTEDACHLACLQPQADTCIDAHIIPEGAGYWLLLLDMREEERKIQAMQQKANELALQREALADRMTSLPGLTAADRSALTFAPAGDRKVIAVLAGGIRLAASRAAEGAPADLLDHITLFRRRIAAGVQAEAGLIYARTSDMLITFFGLLPAETERGVQVLSTALKILQDAPSFLQDIQAPAREAIYPAFGVATGTVVVGLERGDGAGRLQAVGEPIQTAVRLQLQAAAGQVLIDQTTFEEAGALQKKFHPQPTGGRQRHGHVYAHRRTSST